MPIQIHGKDYVTVAERLTEAREHLKSINTEVVPNGGMVIVKATVTTDKGVFTGISAANPSKAIEKMSPYEVAETSAVGRALGFAGFGAVDSIATADEMVKAETTDTSEAWLDKDEPKTPRQFACTTCGEPATMKHGKKNGKEWSGFFCSSGDRSHTQWM